MVHLSEESITEFQALYKQETGRDISQEEAAAYGLQLLRLAETLLRMPSEPSG